MTLKEDVMPIIWAEYAKTGQFRVFNSQEHWRSSFVITLIRVMVVQRQPIKAFSAWLAVDLERCRRRSLCAVFRWDN